MERSQSQRQTRNTLRRATCVGALCLASLNVAHAIGEGDSNVVLGDASFQVNAAGNLIIEAQDGTIIEWNQFDILPNEVVQFVMANASDAVLNRVTGNTPSQILGTLASNGQVYLINPNGIVFGGNAQVNVGGLVASTLGVTNANFASGEPLNFIGQPNNGNIQQNGSITAAAGSVVLIAPQVNSNGDIAALGGQVLLIGSDRVLLMDRSNPSVGIELDRNGVVNHNGTIEVGNGMAMLAAQTISASGVVTANSARQNEQGEIILSASSVHLHGNSQLNADAADNTITIIDHDGSGDGGRITIDADDVRIDSNSELSTVGRGSGDGGTISITGRDSLLLRGNLAGSGGENGGRNGTLNVSSQQLNIVNVETASLGQVDVDTMSSFNTVNLTADDDIHVIAQMENHHLNQNQAGGTLNLDAGRAITVSGSLGSEANALDANVRLSGNDGVQIVGGINATNVTLKSQQGDIVTNGGTVSGETITAIAEGNIDLEGNIDRFVGISTEGDITLNDVEGDIQIEHAHAANGNITVDCAGDIAVGHVSAGGYAFTPGENAQFTSIGGNVIVSLVDAGDNAGFVIRNAQGNVVHQYDGGGHLGQVEVWLPQGQYTVEHIGAGGYITVAGRVDAAAHAVALTGESLSDLQIAGSSAVIDILASDMRLTGTHTSSTVSMVRPNNRDGAGLDLIGDNTVTVVDPPIVDLGNPPQISQNTVNALIDDLIANHTSSTISVLSALENDNNEEAVRRAKNLPVCQ